MGDAAIAIETMKHEMEALRDDLEEQSDEEVGDDFNKVLVEDALGIISASADLVQASAALQAEADRKSGFIPGQKKDVYIEGSDFNEGLVSAALEVVKAIGALKMAVEDSVKGTVSREYLIVCAQHVKEKCVALEVASGVKNVGIHSKNFGKLKKASFNIKQLTENMGKNAQEATHFSEEATVLKYKIRGGYTTELYYDKTGQYKFTDLLKLREVINKKKAEVDALPQQIRNLRKKQLNTEIGVIHGTKVRVTATQQELDAMKSAQNIQETIGAGLKTEVQQELELKAKTLQAQAVLDKALAKHAAIEAINPENLEDED